MQAAENEVSHKGPNDGDISEDGVTPLRDGEYFVSEFFKKIEIGKSIDKSFQSAVNLTEVYTSSGPEGINGYNAIFLDNALQHPLLDDDGISPFGSNDLSKPGADGTNCEDLYIGVTPVSSNAAGDVIVTHITKTLFLDQGDTSAGLYAYVSKNDFRSLWIEIKSPDYIMPGGSSVQASMDLPKSPYDTYNPVEKKYEWTINDLSIPGTYRVFYFAKDDMSENVSPIMESLVYRAKTGNAAPNPFALVSPVDEASALTTVLLDWEDTNDPNGDQFTYTVLLSKNDSSFTNPLQIERLTDSSYMTGTVDELSDDSRYFWKVQAIDEYGAIRESDVRYFDTDNTNDPRCQVQIYVRDSDTQLPIPAANVTVGGSNLNPIADPLYSGLYIGLVTPSPPDYTLNVSANGYISYGENFPFPANNEFIKIIDLDQSSGAVAMPTIRQESPPQGLYFDPQTIEFECATPGATIRYTTDNSEPSESSLAQTPPITIDGNMNLKVKAFKSGYIPSETLTVNYLILAKGDINGDGVVDMTDAVTVLKILGGDDSLFPVYKEADVNGDNKIGAEEMVYILQKVGKLRD